MKIAASTFPNNIILALTFLVTSVGGAILIYIYFLQEATSETFKDIIFPGLGTFGALIGGGITVFIYYRNSQLRKAEWLYSLFDKFFCLNQYSEIRQLLENYEPDRLNKFEEDLPQHADTALEEKLVDYLNFFEFIASLWILKQLSIKEIRMMFDYYIRKLFEYKFIMNYLQQEGFEGLIKLIDEVRSGPEQI